MAKHPAAVALDTFTKPAAELIRLRRWLYGAGDAKVLMLRCYRRSNGRHARVNERTVLACWSQLDAAKEAAGLSHTDEGIR